MIEELPCHHDGEQAPEIMNITAVQTMEEGEYRRAKTSVWWDIENCPVPKGCDAHGIALKLSSALMKTNYCGPLSISSYGNTNQIPNSVQQALASTGIALNHVPSGKKNASDKKILVDMLLWVVENPAPANIMLISGDGDFSDALHLLRMRRYNILLAHPQQASPLLVASATTTWLWGSLFPLTHCDSSSRLVDNESYPSDFDISSQGVSEQVLSSQSMGLDSNTSRTAGSKLKGKELQMNCTETGESAWFCKVCNVACKNVELLTMDLLGKEHDAQRLEMKSGEPENALAGPSEHLEENMNEKKKKKKKRKKNRVIEDKTEAYVCSICSVIFDHPTVFELHINGRKHKHAAMIKKHTEALLDGKQIEEEIIQDNGHSEEMIEEIRSQPGEAHKYIECLEKQNKELGENENKPLPNEACILTRGLESIAKENLEMKSGDPESNTGGATENPEEYMDEKKTKDKATKDAYVCSICSVICNCPIDFESHLMGRKHASRVKKHEEALVDVKNIEESGQDNDLQSRDAQDSMKCFEEQNMELVETCTTSETSGRELRQVFRELRECFDVILKKLEPSNEIVIEKCEEGMPKQALEMKSCEPDNSLAGPSEHPEENMNEQKKKKKRKKSSVIDDKAEVYVCTVCSVFCDYPTILESHLKGRKHAAMVKKHTKDLLDDKQIEEEIIQDNGHLKEMTEEIRFQPGEAHAYMECLEKQNKELGENENKPLPNEECMARQEAREGVDAIIKKLELSQDATSTQELESIAKHNPETNSGDPENNSVRTSEYPEEYKKKKKDKDKVTKEAYVCSICNVKCDCPTVFEAHLMGRRHTARIKKREEVFFGDKKTLEEKDHPIDALQEFQFQPEEVQLKESSIKEVSEVTKEGLENESEVPETKEARLSSLVGLSVEDITKESPLRGRGRTMELDWY